MYKHPTSEDALRDERRRNRGGSHHKWVNAVVSRDKETCQHCGITGVEMHAHHIKPYKTFPELRFELSNGLTLCFRCHWKVHAKPENPVNSVEALTGGAEGNTEPSLNRNIEEGVTDRGRAYRRWNGKCEWCSAFISKRASDAKGKKHLFCSYVCAAKYKGKHRTKEHALNISKHHTGKKLSAECRANMSLAQYRRQARERAARAVISSKSAGRESDELS